MNLHKTKYFIPFLLVALINIMLFTLLPSAEARSARGTPCRAIGNCRTDSWDLTPSYSRDLFNHMFRVPVPFNSLFEQHQRQLASLQKSVPRYDIADSKDKMELTFDLPGVRQEDIVIQLEEGGKLLKISGSRKYNRHGRIVKSEFEEAFTINDRLLDVNSITAKLNDGVLVVSAPKLKENLPTAEKRIPIEYSPNDGNKVETAIDTEQVTDRNEPTATNPEGIEISEEEDIEVEKQ
jgi:HSP20 family molecular chaperone IbpA